MNKVFSENAWRDFMAWVQEDRLIYTFDEKNIYIAACKGHYE